MRQIFHAVGNLDALDVVPVENLAVATIRIGFYVRYRYARKFLAALERTAFHVAAVGDSHARKRRAILESLHSDFLDAWRNLNRFQRGTALEGHLGEVSAGCVQLHAFKFAAVQKRLPPHSRDVLWKNDIHGILVAAHDIDISRKVLNLQ